MPELGPSGSVRGAVSNHRPYRDREHMQQRACSEAGFTTISSSPLRTVYSVDIGCATTMLRGERVGTISVIWKPPPFSRLLNS